MEKDLSKRTRVIYSSEDSLNRYRQNDVVFVATESEKDAFSRLETLLPLKDNEARYIILPNEFNSRLYDIVVIKTNENEEGSDTDMIVEHNDQGVFLLGRNRHTYHFKNGALTSAKNKLFIFPDAEWSVIDDHAYANWIMGSCTPGVLNPKRAARELFEGKKQRTEFYVRKENLEKRVETPEKDETLLSYEKTRITVHKSFSLDNLPVSVVKNIEQYFDGLDKDKLAHLALAQGLLMCGLGLMSEEEFIEKYKEIRGERD